MDGLLIASAVVAALALLLIAIVLIIAYKHVKESMGNVKETISRVETKVTAISEQADGLMQRTNLIAENAEEKLESFQKITETAQDLQLTTQQLNNAFTHIAHDLENPPAKEKELLKQASLVTETVARIYYGFKGERKKKANKNQSVKSLPKQ